MVATARQARTSNHAATELPIAIRIPAMTVSPFAAQNWSNQIMSKLYRSAPTAHMVARSVTKPEGMPEAA